MVGGRPRPLPPGVRPVPRARPDAGGHAHPLHHPPVAGGPGWVGARGRPRALRPLVRSRGAAHGRPRGLGVHAERAQRRRHHGLSRSASSLPPCATGRAATPSTPSCAGPIGSGSRRCGPDRGTSRSGSRCRCTTSSCEPGGEERLERIRRPTEDVFFEATGGDDFIGVQTYTRMRIGPDGVIGPRGRGAHHADGLRVLAQRPRGHDPPGLGDDRRHPRARDRERHRHRG